MRVNPIKRAQSEVASARSELLSKQAMRDPSFFVASMLLLLQQMVQGQTIGSEFQIYYYKAIVIL